MSNKKSFYTKFEEVMTKTLVPIAHKVDQQPHLSSVKAGMVAMIPFTILGSFFAIIPALPNMLSPDNFISQFIESNSAILELPVSLSIGLIGLYACIAIAIVLGTKHKLYIPGCVTLSVFAFLFLTATFTDEGALRLGNLGAKGLFIGMFTALGTVSLYNWCKKSRITIRLPDGVPDFVSSSFELIPTTLIVGGVFIMLRVFFISVFGELPPTVLTNFLRPIVGSMDNPWAVLVLHFAVCFVFFFGIHSSVFSPITAPIRTTFIVENIAALSAGTAIPHFYTGGASSAFFGFTGAGITIGCVIACMLSKLERYRKIGRVALFPSLFGINEPILFGAPIILNPIMFIPFVFGGAIIGTLPMFFMSWGWLAKPVFDPPYVGVFLEGFLTNGDYRSILANLLQLVLTTLFYYPFFKIMERQEILTESQNTKTEIPTDNLKLSPEDRALLDEMKLDF